MKNYCYTSKRIIIEYKDIVFYTDNKRTYYTITIHEAFSILEAMGFVLEEPDIESIINKCLEISKYKFQCLYKEAPNYFDCSSFTKWVYAQLGIIIPRLSCDQVKYGNQVELSNWQIGDLIFTSSVNNINGIGHVSMRYDQYHLVHARKNFSVNEKGVVIEKIRNVINKENFCAIRRIIPKDYKFMIAVVPDNHEEINFKSELKSLIIKKWLNKKFGKK